MVNKIVKLIQPFELFGKQVTQIELKEPTGALYTQLGEPYLVIYNQSGSGYPVEQRETISAYLDRCVVHEAGEAVLHKMSLADAKAVKAALLGFFSEAEALLAKNSPTP